MARNSYADDFLVFSGEVVHEKLWKSVNICKSYGEKSVTPFLCGHDVFIQRKIKKVSTHQKSGHVAIGQWDWANVTGKLSIGVVNLYNYDDNVCLFHLLMSFLSLIHGWLKKTTTGHIHVRCWCVYTQVKSRKGYQGCLSSLEVVGEKKSLLEPGITRIPPEYTESIRQGCIGQTFCILPKKQQQ